MLTNKMHVLLPEKPCQCFMEELSFLITIIFVTGFVFHHCRSEILSIMQAARDSLFHIHSLTPPRFSQPSSFLRLTRFLTFNFTSFDKNESPQPFHTASATIHVLHFRQSGASKASQTLPGSGLHRELVHEDPLSIPVHPIPISLRELNNRNPATASPGCPVREPVQGPSKQEHSC
ncbi:hypothetical protein OIU84_012788 [Salix udensis]|uniref:Uncharacterized protein n=1 Tax=Salix udensis TaxID=889485 RepID=A0AAD6JIE0_9ROSI|nr:hypothetical protein OIU84_012788 [Salix udensis]